MVAPTDKNVTSEKQMGTSKGIFAFMSKDVFGGHAEGWKGHVNRSKSHVKRHFLLMPDYWLSRVNGDIEIKRAASLAKRRGIELWRGASDDRTLSYSQVDE